MGNNFAVVIIIFVSQTAMALLYSKNCVPKINHLNLPPSLELKVTILTLCRCPCHLSCCYWWWWYCCCHFYCYRCLPLDYHPVMTTLLQIFLYGTYFVRYPVVVRGWLVALLLLLFGDVSSSIRMNRFRLTLSLFILLLHQFMTK